MNNYQLLVMGNNMIFNHYITTKVNLLEEYKMALVRGTGVVLWEKGCFNLETIVGIIDTTPEPPEK